MSHTNIKSATLIHIPMIESPAAMAFALQETHKYFTGFPASNLGWTPPPIPPEVMSFIPCSLLITDANNIHTGENTGRIRFLQDVQGHDTDITHYDQQWTLSKADRPSR